MPNDDFHAWSYFNPVNIKFNVSASTELVTELRGHRYAVVTYDEPYFAKICKELEDLVGPAECTINDVQPNPDCQILHGQCERLNSKVTNIEIIVALGGGSVIDTAKVLSASTLGFSKVLDFVTNEKKELNLPSIPIIAVPTTAGTGSEVTCWATIWDKTEQKKYSLADPDLYPKYAIIDPSLMVNKPVDLTMATGLDALSHALESIWNCNANPVSARYAIFAAKTIIRDLPELLSMPKNLALRENLAEAALMSGLAFSNTKTAIAHNLSYPITLKYGVTHGIACSFTLPTILRSVAKIGGFRGEALQEIFGTNLLKGADMLTSTLSAMQVKMRFRDYGANQEETTNIIDAAFLGQRGKNFIGSKEDFLVSARAGNVV